MTYITRWVTPGVKSTMISSLTVEHCDVSTKRYLGVQRARRDGPMSSSDQLSWESTDPSCRNNSQIARSLLNGAWEQHKCAPATTVMHVRHQCGRLNIEATTSMMSRFTFRASDGWLSANCEGIPDATDVNSMCHGFNRLYLLRYLYHP
jgi:hypothetical protein